MRGRETETDRHRETEGHRLGEKEKKHFMLTLGRIFAKLIRTRDSHSDGMNDE